MDTFLEAGVEPEAVQHRVRAASILHSDGDAMDIAVKDGRMVGVRGRIDDRVNRGRLGPKDLFGWQANGSPDRLTTPLIRQHGHLGECDWDTAMERIVALSRELLADRGPASLGFYTSGQLFLEEYYTLAVLVRAGIGTNHLDGNTRLCTATAGEALKESFGCDGQPGCYDDIDHADVIALFGHNIAETQPVQWMRVPDRLAGSDPPRLLCVDPRPTQVAHHAEVHLAPRLGTNVTLLNALLHEIIRTDRVDHDFVTAHTVGFEELLRRVERCTPEWAAGICDVPAALIGEAAELLGSADRLLSTVLQGVYQSHQATAAAVQVNNLHLIRGMLGRPGAGVLQMNGQTQRGEHARVRGQRRPAWLPQLAERQSCRRSGPRVERRTADDPPLRTAHPRHADVPLRRTGNAPHAVDQRHQPGRVPAGVVPHPRDPVPGAALRRRTGSVPHRDRSAGRRRPARGDLG